MSTIKGSLISSFTSAFTGKPGRVEGSAFNAGSVSDSFTMGAEVQDKPVNPLEMRNLVRSSPPPQEKKAGGNLADLTGAALKKAAVTGLAGLCLFGNVVAAQPVFAEESPEKLPVQEFVRENPHSAQSQGETPADTIPIQPECSQTSSAADTIQITVKVSENKEVQETTPYGINAIRGQMLANQTKKIATRWNSVGKCYKAVTQALKSVSIYVESNSAYMAANQLSKSPKVKEVSVKQDQLKKLPAGSIVVWGKTKKSPHGHISVSLGDGREASDHIESQMTQLRGFTNYRVFVPISK